MTVYVVQIHQRRGEGGTWVPVHDVTSASEHGRIEVMLSPRAVPYNPPVILAELHERLCAYNADRDYLVLIGSPTLCAWAAAIAAGNDPKGRLSVLEWNSRQGRYRPVRAGVLEDCSPLEDEEES